ncbi:hypothetical protein DQ04_11111030, partial [Trypanosoma grayi]|uniref:hypothetical protein n=1 Tax=Trypanosoma grayi TaxID=71804 RepID=UPI0004F4253A
LCDAVSRAPQSSPGGERCWRSASPDNAGCWTLVPRWGGRHRQGAGAVENAFTRALGVGYFYPQVEKQGGKSLAEHVFVSFPVVRLRTPFLRPAFYSFANVIDGGLWCLGWSPLGVGGLFFLEA